MGTFGDMWTLECILRASERIEYIVSRMKTQEGYRRDMDMQSLAVGNLKYISDMSRQQLSSECRSSIPGVDWEWLMGLEDWLSQYTGNFEDEVIWNILVHGTPSIKKPVRDRLTELEKDNLSVAEQVGVMLGDRWK